MPVVGENLGVTCGNILGRSYELLSELQPEGYLVLGDTNSCLSAISAKRLHIPLFHMEAGNRCKDECLPEETNRRIVDVISDVNMCYSEFARKYLADTGLPKERTYQTGSPMAEVLHMNLEKIQKSDVLERLGLEKDKYILLSAHREENIDSEKNFLSLFTAINALAEKYDMPILYSCHPAASTVWNRAASSLTLVSGQRAAGLQRLQQAADERAGNRLRLRHSARGEQLLSVHRSSHRRRVHPYQYGTS